MDDYKYSRDRNTGAWIDHSDRLYVSATSSVASLVVRFSGYFRSMNGELREYAVDVNPTSDRVVTEANQHFGPGFLLSCVARIISGNANVGQCYVSARIQRSAGTPVLVLEQLIGGYVMDGFAPSWPWGRIESPIASAGAIRSITGTDPAAGAEISETVPTGARWQVHAIRYTLVTDATVANRRSRIVIDDGTNEVYRHKFASDQTASTTVQYTAGTQGTDAGLAVLTLTTSLPQTAHLVAGWRIRTVTENLQAADNYGAPQLWVEEFLEA